MIQYIENAIEAEIEFNAMLKRIGGGFKFAGWLDKNVNNKRRRTQFAKSIGASSAAGLYACDFSKTSFIVAHACVIDLDGISRYSGAITYYEDEGLSIEELLGTALGKEVASYSDQVAGQLDLNFGRNFFNLLIYLTRGVSKNIADF